MDKLVLGFALICIVTDLGGVSLVKKTIQPLRRYRVSMDNSADLSSAQSSDFFNRI